MKKQEGGRQVCLLPCLCRHNNESGYKGKLRKSDKNTGGLIWLFVENIHCLYCGKVLKFYTEKMLWTERSGKELIMAAKITSLNNMLPVMGSSSFYFTMARFYAGLFAVPENRSCPIQN